MTAQRVTAQPSLPPAPRCSRLPDHVAALAVGLSAALLLVTSAGAQNGTGVPQDPSLPVQPIDPLVPGSQYPGVQAVQPQRQAEAAINALTPRWTDDPALPQFQGFPVFPSRLSGYGAYPLLPNRGLLPNQGLLPTQGLLPLPPPTEVPQEPPGWPSWLRLQAKEPLPFAPELGLLVRNQDRVWWRAANEDVFVPLYFYDKLRSCGVGDQIEVRQAGDFELLLHTSTRLIAQGPTRLHITALDEHNVVLEVKRLTSLSIAASQRTHQITLPDGSVLVLPPEAIAASSPAAAMPSLPLLGMPNAAPTPDAGPQLVLIQRADEPGWLGGRATIWNGGPRDLIWRHAFGETRLPPQHRVTLFLDPPVSPILLPLATDQVEIERAGTAITCRSANGGSVAWCGAHFRVAGGGALRIDPLQGNPFAPLSAEPRHTP